jgi:Fe-S-cluster containining protein
LKTNEDIARISLDPKTKQISDITLHKKDLRFKCTRCAIFCCKLGGPNLTESDAQRIEPSGYAGKGVIVPFVSGSDCSSEFFGSLKSKEDGSCIFLKTSPRARKEKTYECSVYSHRPTLCRLYPFEFRKTDSQVIIVRLIPCCLGLNTPEGEVIDEKFITDIILDAIS